MSPNSDEKSEALVPDQVLTKADLEVRELDAVMHGCPGYEWLDEPNWPPPKQIEKKN